MAKIAPWWLAHRAVSSKNYPPEKVGLKFILLKKKNMI